MISIDESNFCAPVSFNIIAELPEATLSIVTEYLPKPSICCISCSDNYRTISLFSKLGLATRIFFMV